MGLLDDAIREHLDLKRKHGAAEDDLQRQQVEALGPARRDFAASPRADEEPADPAAVEAEPAPPAEPAGWLDDEPAPFDATAEAAVAEPIEAVPAEPIEPAAREPLEAPEPEPEPVAQAPEPTIVQEPAPAAAEPPRTSDTPTQGFDALSVDDEPAAEGDEDVLEETPDFLQDTPEHDRLWFEQKPPRDFDFDD